MAELEKDREEALDVAVNFAPRLNDGDAVDAVQSVEVVKQDGGPGSGWSDASGEFGSPSGTLDGDVVVVRLGAAGATDQVPTRSTDPPTRYRVRVTVTTEGGETLIHAPTLEVTAEGDTDAP